MPDPYLDGECEPYTLGGRDLLPDERDVELANEVYGADCVNMALSKWRRASNADATLREDFLWRPEQPARHSSFASFAIDRLTTATAAEALTNRVFFP